MGELAVLYGEASPGQRAEIRRSLAGLDTWDLVLYVRRVALPIHSPTDVDWLKKGLAAASIENGQFDFRDTIVSLVLLRYAAEKAGIDARQHFDETIAISDKAVVSSLENARDHRPGDMRDIIYQFGPREWEQPSRSLLHQHGRCKGT